MHNDLYKQLRNTEDREAERLKRLMNEIKRILSKKQKQSKVKRLINNRKKPMTEPKGW